MFSIWNAFVNINTKRCYYCDIVKTKHREIQPTLTFEQAEVGAMF